MSTNLYDVTVPLYLKTLGNLSAILEKGAAFAAERKFDPATLLSYRLAPDMFPLTRQVQTAADQAKRAVARLAGVEAPPYEDNEASFADLQARIAKTVAFINTIKPEQMEGAATRQIVLKLGGKERTFTGQAYLLHNALPNFFFHASATYDILRHAGVHLGKADFLGLL